MPRVCALLFLAGVALAALRPSRPRPMVGLWAMLTPEQRARILAPQHPLTIH